jgi:hypothetical protein
LLVAYGLLGAGVAASLIGCIINAPRDIQSDPLGPGLELAQVTLAIRHLTSHLSQRPAPGLTKPAQLNPGLLT